MMKIAIYILGFVFAFAMIIMGYQASDIALNFTRIPALVTSVDQDCFVKSGKRKIVKEGTREIAYFNCDEARNAAKQEGYATDSVHMRLKVNYNYTSPADGKQYSGSYERTDPTRLLQEGMSTFVYAHTSHGPETRTPRANLFVADTGD